MIRIVKVYKRYWWPHIYARERRLLWVKVVDGYRYFVDGVETDLHGAAHQHHLRRAVSEVRRSMEKEIPDERSYHERQRSAIAQALLRQTEP